MDEGGASGWHFNGCALCLTGELALLGRNFHNHSIPYATVALEILQAFLRVNSQGFRDDHDYIYIYNEFRVKMNMDLAHQN